MTMATQTRQMGESAQSNAKVITPTPDEIKALLLTDGQWHDVSNVEKVQFSISEAHSPTNPDKLYPALRCDENGASVVYPFRQIVGYSSQQSSDLQANGNRQGRQQFGTTAGG